MSIFCGNDGDYDGDDWWWCPPNTEVPLATKRSRKCCSCGGRIAVGDTTRKVIRFRPPSSRVEERIHGDEVPLSDWYLCEKCGDLALSLEELGFCYELGGDSLQTQIADYRASAGTQG